MLVHRVANPIDSRIITDGLVVGVDHHTLIPIVSSVVANPVRVENTQFATLPAYTLLGNALKVAGCLLLLHTMVCWLSVDNALEAHPLAATTLNTDTVDHHALLGLVTQLPGLVWS